METGMKGSFTTRKGALYCIVMTCLCSLLATGCASKYGAQTTDVHYYPDCYQPIADLRSAEKSFNTTMVMGTTMGALLGAVIGASQTGKAEGALAGAAIGAGAGAGASYLVAKYNNERDDRVRLASYARDLNADVNSLNRVTAAGQVAYNCYSAKFRAALEDYKAKRITRAELDQRYAEIKSGLAEVRHSGQHAQRGRQARSRIPAGADRRGKEGQPPDPPGTDRGHDIQEDQQDHENRHAQADGRPVAEPFQRRGLIQGIHGAAHRGEVGSRRDPAADGQGDARSGLVGNGSGEGGRLLGGSFRNIAF